MATSIAQRLDVVIADIHTADLDRAVRDIVQARNQLHQRRLRRAGAAEDADGLTGIDVQVDVFERELALVALVAEVDTSSKSIAPSFTS